MFTLKIHTVDYQPLHGTFTATTSGGPSAKSNNNPKPVELKGVAHLFRQLPSATHPAVTVASISARTTLVFVVAVPNYLSKNDFLVFCGNHVPYFKEIIFLKNDGMKDRYSVLIKFESQFAADGFYCSYNSKRFKPPEVDVCHIYFAQSVMYTDSAEIACAPPPDYTEFPTCPVCVERLDPDTSGIQSTLSDHSFHCSCVSKWTYLSCPICRLCQQQDEKPACAVCGTFENLWICLICGFVGCGRYEQGHALGHGSDKQHQFSLGLEKQQIWDYVGEKYVHRLNQSKVGGKSVVVNSRCSSVEECGTRGYDEEEEGLDGALSSSKIEEILDEYNSNIMEKLSEQRQFEHQEIMSLTSKHFEKMEMEAQLTREILANEVANKQAYRAEKKAERQRKEDERILAFDLNVPKMNPQLRSHYAKMQKEIIARRFS